MEIILLRVHCDAIFGAILLFCKEKKSPTCTWNLCFLTNRGRIMIFNHPMKLKSFLASYQCKSKRQEKPKHSSCFNHQQKLLFYYHIRFQFPVHYLVIIYPSAAIDLHFTAHQHMFLTILMSLFSAVECTSSSYVYCITKTEVLEKLKLII